MFQSTPNKYSSKTQPRSVAQRPGTGPCELRVNAVELLAATQRQKLNENRFETPHFKSTLQQLIAHDKFHDTTHADHFLDTFLQLPSVGRLELSDRESQPYIPLPARNIIDLIDSVGISANDTFLDLGSGLGRVLLTVHLLTNASCIGLELNPTLVDLASESTKRLGIQNVTTLMQDISDADYRDATVVFAYAPCFGRAWRQCTDSLTRAARHRSFSVVTLGPVEPNLRDSRYFEDVSANGFQIYRRTPARA